MESVRLIAAALLQKKPPYLRPIPERQLGRPFKSRRYGRTSEQSGAEEEAER